MSRAAGSQWTCSASPDDSSLAKLLARSRGLQPTAGSPLARSVPQGAWPVPVLQLLRAQRAQALQIGEGLGGFAAPAQKDGRVELGVASDLSGTQRLHHTTELRRVVRLVGKDELVVPQAIGVHRVGQDAATG